MRRLDNTDIIKIIKELNEKGLNTLDIINPLLSGERVCLNCGCNDLNVCDGGCYWIAIDKNSNFGICSNCITELPKYKKGILSDVNKFKNLANYSFSKDFEDLPRNIIFCKNQIINEHLHKILIEKFFSNKHIAFQTCEDHGYETIATKFEEKEEFLDAYYNMFGEEYSIDEIITLNIFYSIEIDSYIAQTLNKDESCNNYLPITKVWAFEY